MLSVKAREAAYIILKVFGMTQLRIKQANALTTSQATKLATYMQWKIIYLIYENIRNLVGHVGRNSNLQLCFHKYWGVLLKIFCNSHRNQKSDTDNNDTNESRRNIV